MHDPCSGDGLDGATKVNDNDVTGDGGNSKVVNEHMLEHGKKWMNRKDIYGGGDSDAEPVADVDQRSMQGTPLGQR